MDALDHKDFVDALLLALIAGCVDAVGFLQIGGFFVSFMSGNSTRMGLGLGSGSWHDAGLAFGIIALFVGGVAVGSMVGVRSGRYRRPVLMLLQGALLAMAAAVYHAGHMSFATAPMIVAMGIANTVFGVAGEARFGVTYMTGALVRIGQSIASVSHGGKLEDWKPYAAMWLSLITGVTIGAQLYLYKGGGVLWLPAIILLVLGMIRWMGLRKVRA